LERILSVLKKLITLTWQQTQRFGRKVTGTSIAKQKGRGSLNAVCTIAEAVVYMRYKLNGQHYERWVETWEAKHVRRDLENQGAVIYWTERK
tara:strand:+ start:345 stop:620 length:276 start_codon:yes stop_codon:yes gene_type:complete